MSSMYGLQYSICLCACYFSVTAANAPVVSQKSKKSTRTTTSSTLSSSYLVSPCLCSICLISISKPWGHQARPLLCSILLFCALLVLSNKPTCVLR